MLKFYSDTKIYMHCPAGVVTGGAELLHQLVSFLRDNGRDAYIVYFGNVKEQVVPEDYSKYNIALSQQVEDNSHNIEIYYEGIFERVNTHKNTQKFLWWISVDNFFLCAYPFMGVRELLKWDRHMAWNKLKEKINLLRHMRNPFRPDILRLQDLVDMNIPCGYQAEYIQHFLQEKGFKELFPLKDYINTDHCVSFTREGRDDIIVYNPKKGLDFTQKLIAASPDLEWVPLQGMSRLQLISTIRRAKIYVDFGYHPGKDRLPRECAMNGCCIITGMRGSAGFFEDVALPNKYKFDERNSQINDIVNIIRDTLKNYLNAIDDFAYYRNNISLEKPEFEQQIKNLFQIY